jgi:hypothetical protein
MVYHPQGWLRLHAGAGYNLISPGVRAGVSVMRVRGAVRPALIIEGGRYFDGDANPLMQQLTGDPDYHEESMSQVGYDWASAHLGLELGTSHVRFFLHAGVSEIRSRVRDAGTMGSDAGVRFEQDPRLRGRVPSARLGLIFYLR